MTVTRREISLGLLMAGPSLGCAPAAGAPAPAWKSPLRQRALLPPGVGIDRSNPTLPAIYVKRSANLDRWDLRGHTIYIDDDVQVAITNSKLGPPPSRANAYGQGQNRPTGAPQVTISDCDIDLASPVAGYFNGLMIFSGSLTLRRCKLRNAPVSFVNFQSKTPGAMFLCEENEFGCPGVNSVADPIRPENNSHCEAVVVQAGRAIIRRNRFDPGEDARLTKAKTMTGQLLIQGQFGPVDAVVEENQILGARRMRAPYAIQSGGGRYSTRLRLENNIFEAGDAGPSAYVLADPSVAMVTRGNRDLRGGRTF